MRHYYFIALRTPNPLAAALFFAATLILTPSLTVAEDEAVAVHAWFDSPTNIVMRLVIPDGLKVFAESVSVAASAENPDASSGSSDNAENGKIFAPPRVLRSTLKPTPEHLFFGVEAGDFYRGEAIFIYALPDEFAKSHQLTVTYQACAEDICYLPRTIRFSSSDGAASALSAAVADADAASAAAQFAPFPPSRLAPVRTLSGYVSPDEFLRFLAPDSAAPAGFVDRARAKGGILLLFLAALVAGAALNLTPCVLPLIPVNLALIGRGFKRGAFFGAGIASVFGAAGLASALTGAALFGYAQASALFNAAVAAVFCILALAMLDAIRIDFSGLAKFFRRKKTTPSFSLAGAFAGGALSALLAGACVAPALVSMLVISAEMTAKGSAAGYALPFVFGLGMALPWAFLGGGLMKLPRAGKWSLWIKRAFALVFLFMAIRSLGDARRILVPPAADESDGAIAWISEPSAINAALAGGRPAFVYLTADWCVACVKMSRVTFADPGVAEAAKKYRAIKIDCTDYSRPEVREWLKKTGARGLPHLAIIDLQTAVNLPSDLCF